METLRMSRTNVNHVILGIMRHPGRLDCTQFGVLFRHMAENVQTRQTLFHEIKKSIYLDLDQQMFALYQYIVR